MAARHRKCPTPEKVKYYTHGAALTVLRRKLGAGRAEARAYKCRNHWHLTSKTMLR